MGVCCHRLLVIVTDVQLKEAIIAYSCCLIDYMSQLSVEVDQSHDDSSTLTYSITLRINKIICCTSSTCTNMEPLLQQISFLLTCEEVVNPHVQQVADM